MLKSPDQNIADIIDRSKDNKNQDQINRTGLPLTIPEGFEIDIFARGLGKVRVIINGLNGGLIASLMDAGKVVAMPDIDLDGRADGVFTVVEDLYNPHGLMLMCENGNNCKLYIAETNAVSIYDFDSKTLKATNRNKIIDLPDDGGHFTRTLMRATIEGEEKLLISVGSSCNVCEEEDWRRSTILVSDLDGTNLEIFASGLRNSVFMATHPVTGEFWATDMGRDWLGDDLPPEEINIIRQGQDYGWPLCYGQNIHDTNYDKNQYVRNPCEDKVPAHIEMPAHSAPLGVAFFGEEGWNEEYWYNALVAYHGSWNRTKPTGYKVVRIKLDENGRHLGTEDFISGWLTENNNALGRPVDILIRPGGTMFISDDKAGVIYRLSKLSEENIAEEIDVTNQIKIDSIPNHIPSPLGISGQARGTWYFEGDFPIEIRDNSGNLVAQSFATAQGEWMTENWVDYRAEIRFSPPQTESGFLILRKDNPSDLPEHDAELKLPVRFKMTTYLAGETCQLTSDCQLPMDYAIRSSCPYEAQCIENKCTVVCPDF